MKWCAEINKFQWSHCNLLICWRGWNKCVWGFSVFHNFDPQIRRVDQYQPLWTVLTLEGTERWIQNGGSYLSLLVARVAPFNFIWSSSVSHSINCSTKQECFADSYETKANWTKNLLNKLWTELTLTERDKLPFVSLFFILFYEIMYNLESKMPRGHMWRPAPSTCSTALSTQIDACISACRCISTASDI